VVVVVVVVVVMIDWLSASGLVYVIYFCRWQCTITGSFSRFSSCGGQTSAAAAAAAAHPCFLLDSCNEFHQYPRAYYPTSIILSSPSSHTNSIIQIHTPVSAFLRNGRLHSSWLTPLSAVTAAFLRLCVLADVDAPLPAALWDVCKKCVQVIMRGVTRDVEFMSIVTIASSWLRAA
jgi:hypothetical protein